MSLTVTARGTFTHNTSASSFTCAVASNCTAGARIVICIAADNSSSGGSTNDFTTVTDSLGNTWTKHQSPVFDNGAASAGVQGAIYSTLQNAGTIQTGTVITVAFGSSPTAKTGCFWEITAASGFQANFRTGADKAAGATGTAATLGASPTVNVGEACVAAIYMESGTTQTYTGDSDATNGSWNTAQYAEIGSTTSGSCCGSQVKTQTTTNSTQTYDATLGISADYHGSYAIFQEVQINYNGTVSVTLGSLTTSTAGTVDVFGTSSPTFGALTTSTAGTVDIFGTASPTFGALTISADGTVATAGVNGDANITLGTLTTSTAGTVDIAGISSLTFGTLTTSTAGTVDIAGASSLTFGALTTSTAGKVDITGAASPTFGALTTSTAGKVDIAGLSSPTFGALTTSTTGKVDIAGLANITLGALTVTADGSGFVSTEGQANITLGALTAGATGQVDIQGQANITLGALTGPATGEVYALGPETIAQVNATFKPLTAAIRAETNWLEYYLTLNIENAMIIHLDGTTEKAV